MCEGEAFVDEPSFGFCSGVVFSSRYVLTAEHCTRALPLTEQVALSGFFYGAPRRLGTFGGTTRYAMSRVVASDDFYDYAWIELADEVELPALEVAGTTEGEAIVSAHHSGGLPAKLTRSTATVVDGDFFLSTLDAFGGASGGPVFSESGGILGILPSGAGDYPVTAEGCSRAIQRLDSSESAAELSVRAGRTVEGLCSQVPAAEPCHSPTSSRARIPWRVTCGRGSASRPSRSRDGFDDCQEDQLFSSR